MKKWLYASLVAFIAVAAYKSGYYRDKLHVSDQHQQQLAADLDKAAPRQAVAAPPSDAPSVTRQQEQQLKAFFTLHPSAEHLLLHSVRCSLQGCEMSGEFSGQVQDFKAMMEQLQEESWWHFSHLTNDSSSTDGITHFVVQMSPDASS